MRGGGVGFCQRTIKASINQNFIDEFNFYIPSRSSCKWKDLVLIVGIKIEISSEPVYKISEVKYKHRKIWNP